MKRVSNVFLLVATVFLSGCATYSPQDFIFRVNFKGVPNSRGRIEIKEKKTIGNYAVSPWEKLNKTKDTDVDEIEVLVDHTLPKITLEIVDPVARNDFNDDYVDIYPNLIHVKIDQKALGITVIDKRHFYFTYDIYNTGASITVIMLDMDYNGNFKTKRDITIRWVDMNKVDK